MLSINVYSYIFCPQLLFLKSTLFPIRTNDKIVSTKKMLKQWSRETITYKPQDNIIAFLMSETGEQLQGSSLILRLAFR